MDAEARSNDIPLKKMDKTTKTVYLSSLALAIAILVIGSIINEIDKVLLSILIIFLLIGTLFYDRKMIHIPPAFIFVIIAAMYLSLISNFITGDDEKFATVTSVFTGFVLGTCGIILAYISTGKKPGSKSERTGSIAIESFSVGVAAYAIWVIVSYSLLMLSGEGVTVSTFQLMMARSIFNAIGAGLIALIYYFGFRGGYFDKVIMRFFEKNSEKMGFEINELDAVNSLIVTGESYELEFKSTLRMNLNTGEKDKRMEKAVLKTIVAFLNSDGGTLLVGVGDDGNIIGADVETFENQDKMNLHITNLLSSQIGDEFIPFIKFKTINFGKKDTGADKIVIRFDCTPTSSPAFFKDGKEEIYFMRSGPSSVELTGNDLLKYVYNRNRGGRGRFILKKKYAAVRPQQKV